LPDQHGDVVAGADREDVEQQGFDRGHARARSRNGDDEGDDRPGVAVDGGKDVDRPQLSEMLRFVRAEDTVVVHSLNRWPVISTISVDWSTS